MGELWFDVAADEALTALEQDPSRPRLGEAVDSVLVHLADDPGHYSLRRIRFHVPGLWCVTVRDERDEWAVLWEPHPEIVGDVWVQYVGPASFT